MTAAAADRYQENEDPWAAGLEYERMDEGVHATALVHPEATVSPTAKIGPDTVIGAGAVIEDGSVGRGTTIKAGAKLRSGVSVGPESVIAENAEIGPDATLDHHVTVGGDSRITGDAGIGEDTVISEHVRIGERTSIDSSLVHERAVIGDDCRISRTGMHTGSRAGNGVAIHDAAVMARARIGDNVKMEPGVSIGAGSVVKANTEIGFRDRHQVGYDDRGRGLPREPAPGGHGPEQHAPILRHRPQAPSRKRQARRAQQRRDRPLGEGGSVGLNRRGCENRGAGHHRARRLRRTRSPGRGQRLGESPEPPWETTSSSRPAPPSERTRASNGEPPSRRARCCATASPAICADARRESPPARRSGETR